MSPTQKLSRAINILREDGIWQLFKSSIGYVKNSYGEYSDYSTLIQYKFRYGRHIRVLPHEIGGRTDSKQRRELIRPHITKKDTSAIDIGCATGFFTKKLASQGLLTIGIEQDQDRLNTARALYAQEESIGFMNYWLDKDTIRSLPTVDVILLLTVYHHWVRQEGHDNAENMMKVLADKANKIYFEAPGTTLPGFGGYQEATESDSQNDEPLARRTIRENESVSEYYVDMLETMLGDNIEIHYIGDADYNRNEERVDPIFLIDCRNY